MTFKNKNSLYRLGLAYFLIQLQFWFPIWVIFLLDRGLTFYHVIIADIIFWGSVILLEFPMGYIGDRLGRRTTYLLGALLGAITYFIMTLITNFSLLIISWLCWSIFLATISGTDKAYIYELIKDEGLLAKSNNIFGYFAALTSFSFIVSHFFAGFLYSLNTNLPILINSVCALLAGGIIISLPNPKIEENPHSLPKIREVLVDVAWKNKPVRILIFVLALLFTYSWTTTLIFQPFLTELGLNVELFGIIYLGFTGLGIIGGAITGRLVRFMGAHYLILCGALGMWIAVGLTGFLTGFFGLIGIVLIQFFYYLSECPLEVLINEDISNEYRASIFSLSKLLSSLMLLFFRPFIGSVSDGNTSKFAFQFWFIIGIIPLLIVIVLIVYVMKLIR